MQEDETPKKRNTRAWLKANFVFVLVTIVLLVAAMLSLTYAYKNGRTASTVNNQVATLDTAVPDTLDEAVTESSGPNNEAGGTQDGAQEPKPAPSEEGNTLGASINCLQLDKDESAKLRNSVDKIKIPTTLEEVTKFNQLAGTLYKNYEAIVRSRGCDPKTVIDSILQEAGVNLHELFP